MVGRRFRSSSLLEFNVQQHLERELVNAGFYFNVASGYLSVDGQRGDVLKRVDSNIYESFTDRWVVETDAQGIAGFEVIDPSGVYIDDVFHSKGAAPYLPTIDFRNGRVILLGSGLPESAEVRAEFSYKQVVIDLPDSEIVQVLFSSIRDNVEFTPHAFPSGNQRQLPLLVIDQQDGFNTPGELGGNRNRNQLVTLWIAGTDRDVVNAITDFVQDVQYRKVIEGVDFNDAPELFTVNGDRASTYVNFSTMQASGALQWHKLYIDDSRVVERMQFFNLFRNRVDWRVRIFFMPPGGG